jgi:hypothetical protein
MLPVDPFFAFRFLLVLAAAMVFLLVIAAAVACIAWLWDHPGMGLARRRRRSKAMARFVKRVASGELNDAEREADEVFQTVAVGKRGASGSHAPSGA